MAGRTTRVKERDAVGRAMAIYFEGEVALEWLRSLEKRAGQILKDWSDVLPEEEQDNLRTAQAALAEIDERRIVFADITAKHGSSAPASFGVGGRRRKGHA